MHCVKILSFGQLALVPPQHIYFFFFYSLDAVCSFLILYVFVSSVIIGLAENDAPTPRKKKDKWKIYKCYKSVKLLWLSTRNV